MRLQGRKRAAYTMAKRQDLKRRTERGLTLIETMIALLVMMIVMLAAASLFAYAVYNNSSGADRTQALAVAQESMERFRSAPFTSTTVHPSLNAGTFAQTDIERGGQNSTRLYDIAWTIQDTTPTVKTITVSVTPKGAGAAWATGSPGTVTLITQRARSDNK